MNKFATCSVLTFLTVAAGVQAQQTDDALPSTNPAEGTAADRTPPGQTQTDRTRVDPTKNPVPSTSPTEGTAADRTPPGANTSRTASAAGVRGNDLKGAAVVGSDQTTLGKVVDIVIGERGTPEFVVISTADGKTVALPYDSATSMKTGDSIVVDRSRLQNAPAMRQGEWRTQSDAWKSKSSTYWGGG